MRRILPRVMAAALAALAGGASAVSSESGDDDVNSLLDAAIVVAERQVVAEVENENDNLTSKAGHLAVLARLFGRGGRPGQALAMIEAAEPARVRGGAYGALAVALIEAGDLEHARDVVRRLRKLEEWTASPALIEVARAYRAAGQDETAADIARAIANDSDRVDALVEEARALPSAAKAGAVLKTARKLAGAIPAGGIHEPDWSERQELLMKVLAAYVERGDEAGSDAVLEALSLVPEPEGSISQARGLLERAEHHLRQDETGAATRDLRAAWKLVPTVTEPHLTAFYDSEPELAVTFGSLQAAVEIGRGVANGLDAAGQDGEAKDVLAETEKTADSIAGPEDDQPFLWSKLAELRVRLAGDYRAIGRPEHAAALLAGALDAANRIPFPEGATVEAKTSWDPNASVAVHRVSAFAWAAAGFEAVGDPRAPATLGAALADLRRIYSEEWRGYGWRDIVEAFSATLGRERAIEVVLTPPVPDPDRSLAVWGLGEEILSGPDPETLLPVLAAYPPTYGKVVTLAKLANRLAEEGRRDAAAATVDEALRVVDQCEAYRWSALVLIGAEAPDAGAPASPERRALLRRILGPPSEAAEPGDVELVAVVVGVEMLSRFEGEVIPAGVDPRYALTLRIESASVAVGGFEPGGSVTFAIHSPALLFRGDPEVGKSYRFRFRRTKGGEAQRSSGLEVLFP